MPVMRLCIITLTLICKCFDFGQLYYLKGKLYGTIFVAEMPVAVRTILWKC